MELGFLLTFFGLALVTALIFGIFHLYRSGLFHLVQVSTGRPDFYEMHIAYKLQKGDYKESGKPFGPIVKLCPGYPCVSAYYDHPDKTPAKECRYICGVLLAEGPNEKPDAEMKQKLAENDFRFITFPRVDHAVKATFPYSTQMSPMFGAMKTYPRLAKYIEDKQLHGYPYIEICKEKVIHYMVPLSKNDEFLVDEVKDNN